MTKPPGRAADTTSVIGGGALARSSLSAAGHIVTLASVTGTEEKGWVLSGLGVNIMGPPRPGPIRAKESM